jgi:hypothetical protein
MRPAPTRGALLAALAAWIVAVLAAWLAVGAAAWSQTVLLAGIGGICLVAPPAGAFPRSWLVLSGLLLVLAATAFLPAGWFATAWRRPFQDHGIVLPGTYSLQPWWTLEDLTLLFAGLLWMLNSLSCPLSLEQRRLLLASFVIALAAAAVSTLLRDVSLGQAVPAFVQEVGQFENRNQTGDLLVMGGLGSFILAVARISRRKKSGIFWTLLTLLFLAAVIRNGSRAAAALFVAGLLLASILPDAGPRRQKNWIVLSLVAVAGALLFAGQGGLLWDRLHSWGLEKSDGRLAIYRDTFAMLGHLPWCGVGLGNFDGVFNTQRVFSANPATRMIHPEGDWWWIASDLGAGGVIIVGSMVVLGYRDFLREAPFGHVSRAATVVAIVFFLHGLVDVGGHRLGTMWSCLYLVGLGAWHRRSPRDIRIPPLFFRAAGLLLLVVALLRVQSASVAPWMPTRASLDEVTAQVLGNRLPAPEQKGLLQRGLSWAPLDWLLYYERGLATLRDAGPADSANADFDRALFLEPNTLELPFSIALACRQGDLPEAAVAWRELLRRESGRPQEYEFLGLLADRGLDAQARLELTTLAGDDPNLQAIGVISADPATFDYSLHNLLDLNPTLHGVSPDNLRQLLERWAGGGAAGEYLRVWPQHPEWETAGWRAYARALARNGDDRDAVATAFKFLPARPPPPFPAERDLAEAQRQVHDHPGDLYRGVMLYLAQENAGADSDALQTLTGLAQLPGCPAWLSYLLAQKLHGAGRDSEAWNRLEPLVDQP